VNKKRIFVSFLATALILGACFSSWNGDEGTFSVSIGGAGRTAWNDPETLAQLTHTITLSNGPGPEQTREDVKYNDIVHFSVTPGRWTITITAFLNGNEHATGSRNVTIKPGPNGAIAIKMGPINTGETGPIMVTNGKDDNSEGSLRWAMENSPEVATIIISSEVSTITINNILSLSFEDRTKSVTIKAEEAVTIERGSNHLFQLFSVGGNGTLILGGGDSKPITIDGRNIEAQTSLIDLGGPGDFIMNDGVTLKNNKNNGSNSGGGVTVLNGGTFTMNGGTISGNTATGDNGGGVYVSTGTFIMSGGKISGNSAGLCDGVYVEYGTIIMSGGEISRNGNVDDGKTAVEASMAYEPKYGILNAAGTDIKEPKGGTLSCVRYAIKVVNGIWTFDVENKDQWDTACEEIGIGSDGNNYAINVTGEGFEVDASSSPTFGWNKNITITGITVSSGSIPIISLQAASTGNLLYIVGTPSDKQIVTIENITLQGHSTNNASLVKIDSGGELIMNNGSTITSNARSTQKYSNTHGGGVYVDGTFIMNGGTISGNNAYEAGGDYTWPGRGGGVYVNNGTFTMNGGTISGNNADYQGGGVYVDSGTFTKTGGTIWGYNPSDTENSNVVKYGNTVKDNQGHAVYVYVDPTTNKRRENTAEPGDNLDSTKDGDAGGWKN